MSSPNKRRFKLEEMRVQAAEALGTEPGIELELEDGTFVTVPHPLFLSDERQEAVEKAEASKEIAKAVLGDEEFERFSAAGGHSNDVVLVWSMLQKESEAKDAAGRPTR